MTNSDQDAAELIDRMAERARAASEVLAQTATADKARALAAMARMITSDESAILRANRSDLVKATQKGLSDAMLDRLRLDPERLAAISDSLHAIARLDDPVGQIIDAIERPNGLRLIRQRVPIGVIGMIYESRPNVTADAAGLCIAAGNGVILRGGSEAMATNAAIHRALVAGLEEAGLPIDSVQLVGTSDRAVVGALLRAQGAIDLAIPRGGKELVAFVQSEARVPVLAHLEGNNHVYVHSTAEPDMAERIVVNSKMRRTGVCGALETLLIDRNYPYRNDLISALLAAGCSLRGDRGSRACDERVEPASDEDWSTEYLSSVASVAIVDDLEQAIHHIRKYGSGHTDAIVAEDRSAGNAFVSRIDSAIVLWNASTQFADGGEFGLGAEIGIATGRLHARGPVALEGLTTYKWIGLGTGQTRS